LYPEIKFLLEFLAKNPVFTLLFIQKFSFYSNFYPEIAFLLEFLAENLNSDVIFPKTHFFAHFYSKDLLELSILSKNLLELSILFKNLTHNNIFILKIYLTCQLYPKPNFQHHFYQKPPNIQHFPTFILHIITKTPQITLSQTFSFNKKKQLNNKLPLVFFFLKPQHLLTLLQKTTNDE
jgi:hypothetical protein